MSSYNNKLAVIIAMLFVLFAFGISALMVKSFNDSSTTERTCSYEDLQRKHPEQKENIWQILSVGIEDILNNRTAQSAVYLFVHQGSDSASNLVREVATQSSHCFNKNSPVEMTVSDFTSANSIEDYGYVIERFRAKMHDGNVFLIVNLNEIPAESARALHTICDTYSPIARDLIIFLSLTTPTTEGDVQMTLYELWGSKIGRHELDPLITRVTDQIIPLNS